MLLDEILALEEPTTVVSSVAAMRRVERAHRRRYQICQRPELMRTTMVRVENLRTRSFVDSVHMPIVVMSQASSRTCHDHERTIRVPHPRLSSLQVIQLVHDLLDHPFELPHLHLETRQRFGFRNGIVVDGVGSDVDVQIDRSLQRG